jgi:hypothetical protein
MRVEAKVPVVWKVSLSAAPAAVWRLLDTDAGRERHWALRSETTEAGFRLRFPGSIEGEVKVLEREPERRLRFVYFGCECELVLTRDGDGTILTAIDHGTDPEDWADRHAGWVSWLLILKAAADHGLDLRNHHPDRHWFEGFADP